MAVYKCGFCGKFHVGHDTSEIRNFHEEKYRHIEPQKIIDPFIAKFSEKIKALNDDSTQVKVKYNDNLCKIEISELSYDEPMFKNQLDNIRIKMKKLLEQKIKEHRYNVDDLDFKRLVDFEFEILMHDRIKSHYELVCLVMKSWESLKEISTNALCELA